MATTLPDTFYRTYKPRLYRRIARELRGVRRVVDVGCGDCQLAGFLCEADGSEVIGIDIHNDGFPEKPDPARRRRCVKADARSLDFLPPDSVDAVVSVWALHELVAPMAVLREAKRILRPGGKIVVVDFPRGSLAQRLWHEHYYTTGEVRAMLRRAGFRCVEARRYARKQLTWARGLKPVPRKGRLPSPQ